MFIGLLYVSLFDLECFRCFLRSVGMIVLSFLDVGFGLIFILICWRMFFRLVIILCGCVIGISVVYMVFVEDWLYFGRRIVCVVFLILVVMFRFFWVVVGLWCYLFVKRVWDFLVVKMVLVRGIVIWRGFVFGWSLGRWSLRKDSCCEGEKVWLFLIFYRLGSIWVEFLCKIDKFLEEFGVFWNCGILFIVVFKMLSFFFVLLEVVVLSSLVINVWFFS